MYHPLAFLKQQISPSFLGVDIGTTSMKIVEVDQGKQLPRLTNYAFLESQSSLTRSNTAFQTSSLKLFEGDIARFLAETVKRMKPKAADAVASLPGFAAFMTVLNFPEMSGAEVGSAIALQAKQYIPLPISEVAIDWLKVGEFRDAKGFTFQQLLLISVPQETIKKYQRMFKAAGLTLRALEIQGLSLVRALVGTDPTPTCIVDIGSRSTEVVMVEKGQLKFTAQSDFAGAALTQALAESLNINPLRAEELKRERGIMGTGPNYELSTIMLPFLDVIIGEVKRAMTNYETQFPTAAKIERLILSGGGTNLLGIEKYVGGQFTIPTVKAAPFLRFEYLPALEPLVNELNPLMSVALGLALKELSE
jgi:type IV pilus assembly protein PilM